jgi:hypothetical protein
MNPHIRTYLTEMTRNQCRGFKLLEISIAQESGAGEVVQETGCRGRVAEVDLEQETL